MTKKKTATRQQRGKKEKVAMMFYVTKERRKDIKRLIKPTKKSFSLYMNDLLETLI